MKRIIELCLVIFVLTISFTVFAIDVGDEFMDRGDVEDPSIFGGMDSIADAIRMDGVAGYIEGVSKRTFERMISDEGAGWMCDAFANAMNASKDGKSGSWREVFKQDLALKESVKTELKERIQERLPGLVKEVVLTHLLGSAVGQEKVGEALEIYERVIDEMNTTLNERVDLIADRMYSNVVDEMQAQLVRGELRRIVDVTDLRGSVERAFDLRNIADMAAGGLGRLVGDATVNGIRNRVADALSGNLPPELVDALRRGPEFLDGYVDRMRGYLPGELFDSLTDSVLNAPVIKLPTPAYASILAASAAGHYARAFGGVYVDAYELKRGVEVTRVMVWQIRNKDAINLSVLQLSNLARDIAFGFGAGAQLDEIAGAIGEPLRRIEEITDRIDSLIMGPIEEIQTELRSLVEEIEGRLGELQDYLAAPINDGFGQIQDELGFMTSGINDSLPENFDGMPRSWDDLKDSLGMDGGVLGEYGDIRPADVIGDAFGETIEKVREDFAEVNEAIAEHISEGVSNALYGMHLIGPTAEIMDVERVPAENASTSDELDPVLMHNGEFFLEITDFTIPGRGIDFKFTRIFRGRSNFLGELGWRWTHSCAERMLKNEGGYTYIDDRGLKHFFAEKKGRIASPNGVGAKLKFENDLPILKFGNGIVKSFDARGRLVSISDRYDNRLQFKYRGDLLDAVLDTLGRVIRIERNDRGLITAAIDFADRRFSFDYNDRDELITAKTPPAVGYEEGLVTTYEYYSGSASGKRSHQIVSAIDPKGNRYIVNGFDEDGRVIAQRYGSSLWRHVEYGRGKYGTLTNVADSQGRTYIYEHDAAGHILKKTLEKGDESHLLTRRKYNSGGKLLKDCLPSGRCTEYKYSGGRIVQISQVSTDGKRRTTRIERDEYFDRVKAIDYPSGERVFFHYSENPPHDLMSVSKVGDGGEGIVISRYEYNEHGQPTLYEDALGVKTIYEYGSDGYLEQRSVGQDEPKVDTFLHDEIGNLISMKDSRGLQTDYMFDGINGLIAKADHVSEDEFFIYDENGNMILHEQGDRRLLFAYDELDRMLGSKSRIEGEVWAEQRYLYDDAGRMIASIDPDGRRIDYEYDVFDQLRCETRGLGTLDMAMRCFEYDADGNVVKYIDAMGAVTEYEYDGFGDLARVTYPAGTRLAIVRDVSGRIVDERYFNTKDEILYHAKYSYNWLGLVSLKRELLWVDDYDDGVWVDRGYEYDAAGNPIAYINPLGGRELVRTEPANRVAADVDEDKHNEYDLLGRRTAKISYLNGRRLVKKYEWSKAGKLLAFEGLGGKRAEFVYDDLGRQIAIKYPDGTQRMLSYDGEGRVTGVLNPDGGALIIERDEAGRIRSRRARRAESDDIVERFVYDGMGRPVVMDAGHRVVMKYDSLGRPVAESFDGGWLRRSYDFMGNTTSIDVEGVGSIYSTFDKSGRKTGSIDHDGDIFSLEYDDYGFLRKAALGNRLTFDVRRFEDGKQMARSYLKDSGIMVAGFEVYIDEAGEALGDMYPGELTRWYERDELGRLVSAEERYANTEPDMPPINSWNYRPGDDGAIVNDVEVSKDAAGRVIGIEGAFLTYDAFGRLKSFDNSEASSTYDYDPLGRLISVYGGNGKTEFIWDGWRLVATKRDGGSRLYAYGDGDVPLAFIAGDETNFFITDRIGSAISIAGSDGALTDGCRFTPYGERMECENASSPFCFAGGICDGSSNLVYFRNRFYSPKIASFITPDPLGFKLATDSNAAFYLGPQISFHDKQGQASRATFPGSSNDVMGYYGVYPFWDVLWHGATDSPPGQINLHLYANADPSTFIDPLGLASLIFDRSDERMHLYDGSGDFVTSYLATNGTPRPDADPVIVGGNGPFPDGTFSIGIPEFYSETYREKFYDRFGFGEYIAGESVVLGRHWAKHDLDTEDYSMRFGTLRFRTGGSRSELDRAAWNRQLFLHGGRHNYRSRTLGCIRADDLELETLTANFIAFSRQGDPIETITVRR